MLLGAGRYFSCLSAFPGVSGVLGESLETRLRASWNAEAAHGSVLDREM